MPRNVKEFDKLDMDLLSIVIRDSRLTLEQKSKLVHRSKEVVLYRLQKLQKIGVIRKYGAMINSKALGYASYNFLFELTKVNLDTLKLFEDFLCANPFIRYASKTSGMWDYEVSILIKNHEDFDKFFSEVYEKFGTIIRSNHFHIRTKTLKADNFERIIDSKISLPKIPYRKNNNTPELDAIDFSILKSVCEDSSKSVREIAEECKVSPDQVRYRLSNLGGIIINNYSAQINVEKFGMQEFSILIKLANNTKESWLKFNQFLLISKNVSHAVKTVGEFDSRVHLLCKDNLELEEWISKLREVMKDAIDRIHFSVKHKVLRRDSFPLGKEAIQIKDN